MKGDFGAGDMIVWFIWLVLIFLMSPIVLCVQNKAVSLNKNYNNIVS